VLSLADPSIPAGTRGAPGMRFIAEVQVPASCSGRFYYLQHVDTLRHKIHLNGDEEHLRSAGYQVDTHDPYEPRDGFVVPAGTTGVLESNDAPGTGAGLDYRAVDVEEHFRVWLLWLPDGGTYPADRMTLGVVEWGWQAKARRIAPGDTPSSWVIAQQIVTGGTATIPSAAPPAATVFDNSQPFVPGSGQLKGTAPSPPAGQTQSGAARTALSRRANGQMTSATAPGRGRIVHRQPRPSSAPPRSVVVNEPQDRPYSVNGHHLEHQIVLLSSHAHEHHGEWGRYEANPVHNGTAVTLTPTIDLPQWGGRDWERASPAAQAEWQRMVRALRTHELGHHAIARAWAARAQRALAGAPASQREQVWTDQLDELQRQQDAFDERTHNGADDGVTLNANVATVTNSPAAQQPPTTSPAAPQPQTTRSHRRPQRGH